MGLKKPIPRPSLGNRFLNTSLNNGGNPEVDASKTPVNF
jgi:hypothetical protein